MDAYKENEEILGIPNTVKIVWSNSTKNPVLQTSGYKISDIQIPKEIME